MSPAVKNKKRSTAKKNHQLTQHVFVVTRIVNDHAMPTSRTIMNIYSSKDIAAREAGSLDSYTLGTFEEAMEEYKQNCEYYEDDEVDDEHSGLIDRRQNPPDNGILIRAGSPCEGEGDYVALEIEKFPVITSTNLKVPPRKKIKKQQSDEEDDKSDFIFF